jgi:hypothetical protein
MVETPPETSVPRRSGIRTAFLLLSIVVIFALVFFFLVILPHHAGQPSQPSQQLTSLNWSGYSVVSDLTNPQPEMTSVNATWTVPTIEVSTSNSFSAEWVGIGGQFDQTVIQTGTGQDSIGGVVVYRTWYELVPGALVDISSLNISAGDKITASISLVDANSNTWLIRLSDDTKGQSFSENVVHVASPLSAEWIVERPTVAGQTETLADFGQVTFTNCSATLNGNAGSISSFPSNRITMANSQNLALVNTSDLSGEGSSFTVRYLG